jgi:hypothetical protein
VVAEVVVEEVEVEEEEEEEKEEEEERKRRRRRRGEEEKEEKEQRKERKERNRAQGGETNYIPALRAVLPLAAAYSTSELQQEVRDRPRVVLRTRVRSLHHAVDAVA